MMMNDPSSSPSPVSWRTLSSPLVSTSSRCTHRSNWPFSFVAPSPSRTSHHSSHSHVDDAGTKLKRFQMNKGYYPFPSKPFSPPASSSSVSGRKPRVRAPLKRGSLTASTTAAHNHMQQLDALTQAYLQSQYNEREREREEEHHAIRRDQSQPAPLSSPIPSSLSPHISSSAAPTSSFDSHPFYTLFATRSASHHHDVHPPAMISSRSSLFDGVDVSMMSAPSPPVAAGPWPPAASTPAHAPSHAQLPSHPKRSPFPPSSSLNRHSNRARPLSAPPARVGSERVDESMTPINASISQQPSVKSIIQHIHHQREEEQDQYKYEQKFDVEPPVSVFSPVVPPSRVSSSLCAPLPLPVAGPVHAHDEKEWSAPNNATVTSLQATAAPRADSTNHMIERARFKQELSSAERCFFEKSNMFLTGHTQQQKLSTVVPLSSSSPHSLSSQIISPSHQFTPVFNPQLPRTYPFSPRTSGDGERERERQRERERAQVVKEVPSKSHDNQHTASAWLQPTVNSQTTQYNLHNQPYNHIAPTQATLINQPPNLPSSLIPSSPPTHHFDGPAHFNTIHSPPSSPSKLSSSSPHSSLHFALLSHFLHSPSYLYSSPLPVTADQISQLLDRLGGESYLLQQYHSKDIMSLLWDLEMKHKLQTNQYHQYLQPLTWSEVISEIVSEYEERKFYRWTYKRELQELIEESQTDSQLFEPPVYAALFQSLMPLNQFLDTLLHICNSHLPTPHHTLLLPSPATSLHPTLCIRWVVKRWQSRVKSNKAGKQAMLLKSKEEMFRKLAQDIEMSVLNIEALGEFLRDITQHSLFSQPPAFSHLELYIFYFTLADFSASDPTQSLKEELFILAKSHSFIDLKSLAQHLRQFRVERQQASINTKNSSASQLQPENRRHTFSHSTSTSTAQRSLQPRAPADVAKSQPSTASHAHQPNPFVHIRDVDDEDDEEEDDEEEEEHESDQQHQHEQTLFHHQRHHSTHDESVEFSFHPDDSEPVHDNSSSASSTSSHVDLEPDAPSQSLHDTAHMSDSADDSLLQAADEVNDHSIEQLEDVDIQVLKLESPPVKHHAVKQERKSSTNIAQSQPVANSSHAPKARTSLNFSPPSSSQPTSIRSKPLIVPPSPTSPIKPMSPPSQTRSSNNARPLKTRISSPSTPNKAKSPSTRSKSSSSSSPKAARSPSSHSTASTSSVSSSSQPTVEHTESAPSSLAKRIDNNSLDEDIHNIGPKSSSTSESTLLSSSPSSAVEAHTSAKTSASPSHSTSASHSPVHRAVDSSIDITSQSVNANQSSASHQPTSHKSVDSTELTPHSTVNNSPTSSTRSSQSSDPIYTSHPSLGLKSPVVDARSLAHTSIHDTAELGVGSSPPSKHASIDNINNIQKHTLINSHDQSSQQPHISPAVSSASHTSSPLIEAAPPLSTSESSAAIDVASSATPPRSVSHSRSNSNSSGITSLTVQIIPPSHSPSPVQQIENQNQAADPKEHANSPVSFSSQQPIQAPPGLNINSPPSHSSADSLPASIPTGGLTRAVSAPVEAPPSEDELCDLCDVNMAKVECSECNMKLCLNSCDSEVHKSYDRRKHVRIPWSLSLEAARAAAEKAKALIPTPLARKLSTIGASPLSADSSRRPSFISQHTLPISSSPSAASSRRNSVHNDPVAIEAAKTPSSSPSRHSTPSLKSNNPVLIDFDGDLSLPDLDISGLNFASPHTSPTHRATVAASSSKQSPINNPLLSPLSPVASPTASTSSARASPVPVATATAASPAAVSEHASMLLAGPAPPCDICDDETSQVYCNICNLNLCVDGPNQCDFEIHKPATKQNHLRIGFQP